MPVILGFVHSAGTIYCLFIARNFPRRIFGASNPRLCTLCWNNNRVFIAGHFLDAFLTKLYFPQEDFWCRVIPGLAHSAGTVSCSSAQRWTGLNSLAGTE